MHFLSHYPGGLDRANLPGERVEWLKVELVGAGLPQGGLCVFSFLRNSFRGQSK